MWPFRPNVDRMAARGDVSGLARAIRHADQEIQCRAVTALGASAQAAVGGTRRDEAIAALLSAITSSDLTLATVVVDSLVRIGGRDVAAKLLEFLTTDHDPVAAERAAEVVFFTGGPSDWVQALRLQAASRVAARIVTMLENGRLTSERLSQLANLEATDQDLESHLFATELHRVKDAARQALARALVGIADWDDPTLGIADLVRFGNGSVLREALREDAGKAFMAACLVDQGREKLKRLRTPVAQQKLQKDLSHGQRVLKGASSGRVADSLLELFRKESSRFSEEQLLALTALPDYVARLPMPWAQFSDPDTRPGELKISYENLRGVAMAELKRRGGSAT